MIKYLKVKIGVLLYFMIFFINILAVEREIPHNIVTENPKKDVTTIETLKKYKEKAELNITVTKLKTEEIPIEVDKSRKKMLLTLKGIEGKNIYPVENIEDIPNPNTSLGRRNLNRARNNNNLKTTRYDITIGEKRTKIEIDYNELPKNTYLAVTDKNFNLEKIYRANYKEYSAPRGNSVSVKIWLFGEEMGSLTNLILNPDRNSRGNIEIRKNGEFSYPEDATEQSGLNTVFDMQGQPELFDFEDSDYIELENIGGAGSTAISNIQNRRGSFYKYRNEYAECNIPGYNLKARVWSDTPKLEFTLRKSGTTDGYVKFKILHKASDGTIRQEITVEMFINNKSFNNYFSKSIAYSRVYMFNQVGNDYDYDVGDYYYRIPIEEGVVVSNLICDRLDYNIKTPSTSTPIVVTKTWGERAGQYLLQDYWNEIESYSQGFNEEAYYKIINANVNRSYVKVYHSWINPRAGSGTTQYFEFQGSYLSYAKSKRKIELKNTAGLTDGRFNSFGVNAKGEIIGLPIKNKDLVDKLQNGSEKILEFSLGDKFYIAKKESGSNFIWSFDGEYIYPGGTLLKNGVEFDENYNSNRDDFDYYNLQIKKIELKKEDRNFIIKGIDGVYFMQNDIKIPAFNPEILLNSKTSSLAKNIIRYVDISEKFDTNSGILISLGEIYFNAYDDIGVLKDNSSSSPYVMLPENVYLEDNSNGKIVQVVLSFSRNSVQKEIGMKNYNLSSVSGGGNGGNVYLKMEPLEYQKLVANGGGRTYTLKGEKIKVGIDIDRTPLNGTPAGVIEKEIVSSITIHTNKVEPSISKITFKENTPLLKSEFFSILNQDITYLTPNKDGYNYNQTIDLSGEIAQYNYTTRKHNYEILDNTGRIIKGFITSNGSGGYWENLDIGDGNKVTISQGKDTKTYMALNKWNYRASSGEISIKHYIESSPETNQYFKFTFELPDFDPYTYYDENINTIEKLSTFNINLSNGISINGKKQINLGKVKTQNYDMEITKDESDSQGLRVENQSLEVNILEEATLALTGYKAKIIMKSSGGREITSIVGKNQEAEIYVEVPDNLPSNKNYIIQSSHNDGNIFDDNNYLLRIGRTGFFKELIKEIKILSQQLEGQATINITSDYTLGEEIIFRIASNPFSEGLSLENSVTGISLEDVTGHGMLKIQVGDTAQVQIASSRDIIGNSFYALSEIPFPNGNKMKIGFDVSDNNKLKISFTKIILGSSRESNFRLIIKGADNTIKATYKFKVKFPESFLRIDRVENMDFGQAIVGLNGYKAKGTVFISTAKSISKTNLNITIDTQEVPLIRENNGTLPELKAKIEEEKLEKIDDSILENNYQYILNGELDIPRDINLGIYKGRIQVTVSIRE
jgi:hypothetical protein